PGHWPAHDRLRAGSSGRSDADSGGEAGSRTDPSAPATESSGRSRSAAPTAELGRGLRLVLRHRRVEIVHEMAPEERPDPVEGVAPVLAALPAVALVVVPVDLVELALDRKRLDHLLAHQWHDPPVLATVEDEQRRLDPLRTVER